MNPPNYISPHFQKVHYLSSRNRDFRAAEGLNGGQIGDPVELVNVTETEYMYKFNDYGGKSFEKIFCKKTERSSEWQDELGLGWDANFGLLGYRTQVHNGLNIREWRASDIENQIRSQMGSPLRSSYNGLNLLDSRNNPVRVSGTGNPTIDYIINMYSIFK